MNYVFSALYGIAARKSISLSDATIGIIGVGNVGDVLADGVFAGEQFLADGFVGAVGGDHGVHAAIALNIDRNGLLARRATDFYVQTTDFHISTNNASNVTIS